MKLMAPASDEGLADAIEGWGLPLALLKTMVHYPTKHGRIAWNKYRQWAGRHLTPLEKKLVTSLKAQKGSSKKRNRFKSRKNFFGG